MSNSEKAREISMSELCRALESAGIFDPANPDSYQSLKTTEEVCEALNGKMVDIEITVEKGDAEYGDQNRYRFLTPNPKAGIAYKKWCKLHGKDTTSTVGQPVSTPVAQAATKPLF